MSEAAPEAHNNSAASLIAASMLRRLRPELGEVLTSEGEVVATKPVNELLLLVGRKRSTDEDGVIDDVRERQCAAGMGREPNGDRQDAAAPV